MASAYDEDLAANPLFSTFQKEYPEMFFKIISEGCTICVPRAGSLPKYSITLDDILAHVIYPSEEMPESHFQTLSGKDVKVCNRIVTVTLDGECVLSSKVLFEETYYSEDFLKYKVLCIEQPLEHKDGEQTDGIVELNSLRDCIEFLQMHSDNNDLADYLNQEIEDFCEQEELLSDSSLQTLKDLTVILCDKCLQILLRNKLLRDKCLQNNHNLKNLKLAIETYVHHGISKVLFKYIGNLTSKDDAVLNKMIRNSIDLNLRDMDIKAECHNLIPKAKIELSKISGYNTLLGKLNCLRKMMGIISRDPESGSVLAADDLLPIIIFVIIKTDITNWAAQLAYLKNFRYASNAGDESEFFVTTLEATMEHIRNGVFVAPSSMNGDKTVKTDFLRSKDRTFGLSHLFHQIANDNLSDVKNIFKSEQHSINYSNLKLCHPLCLCEKCKLLISKNVNNVHPTVNSSNESGMSALLVAASCGRPLILDYLLSLNADVNHRDENGLNALHYAAMKGHQHCLLMMAQAGADVNSPDNCLNTPLHYCCMNGHDACAKALIYHSENEASRLIINAENQNGDTPLHHAAKYGYTSMVQLLIDNNADPSILNKRKLTPFNVANNSKISDILKKSKPRFQCGTLIKTINFDFEDKTNAIIPNSPEMLKKVNKMLKAIYHGDINLACFYLGLNPLIKTKICHPLCNCSKCNKPDGTSLANKIVNINFCNNSGITALHVATMYGHIELVKLLIKNGANVDSQTSHLATPLILACQQQRLEIVKLLLDSGANINLQNNRGNTALHNACMQTHSRLVKILLKYKPKLDIRNKLGRTAVEEADIKAALGIVEMLRDCVP